MAHRRRSKVKMLQINAVRLGREDMIFEAQIMDTDCHIRLSGATYHEILGIVYAASQREELSAMAAMEAASACEPTACEPVPILPSRDAD